MTNSVVPIPNEAAARAMSGSGMRMTPLAIGCRVATVAIHPQKNEVRKQSRFG